MDKNNLINKIILMNTIKISKTTIKNKKLCVVNL